MPLDRQVQAILELAEQANNVPYTQLTPVAARAQHAEKSVVLDGKSMRVHAVRDAIVATDNADIPVRVYAPTVSVESQAAVLWIHGGGHVIGSVASYDSVCRRLALDSDAVVVSVDYRLAPEHKFPAAVQDSFAALQWLMANAAEFGIDTNRVCVAGDSAGGNLAAVTAILARDAGIPLRAQALIYPVTGPDAESASHHKNANGYMLTRELLLWFQAHYRRDEQDRKDWRYAPLIADDLRNVAPALVLVAEFDPLRDEGIAYAQRLMDSEVEVRLSHYAGMVHAFFNMAGAIDAAHRAMDEVTEFLRVHSQ